jgi:hypothetical protein
MATKEGSRQECATGRLWRGSGIVDQPLLATDFDRVARDKFPTSSGFDLAIHHDFARLDQQLGLTTSLGNRAELQELVEAQRVGVRSRVSVGHG